MPRKHNSPEWDAMTIDDKMQLLRDCTAEHSVDNVSPLMEDWDNNRPDWAPAARTLINQFCVPYTTLMMTLGFEPRARSLTDRRCELRCDAGCGKLVSEYRTATVRILGGDEKDVVIPLCADCAIIWDEDEGIA